MQRLAEGLGTPFNFYCCRFVERPGEFLGLGTPFNFYCCRFVVFLVSLPV